MKRCITLISLGLCLAVPMLSQANDIKPLMHVTNVHNGQYDAALATITDYKVLWTVSIPSIKECYRNAG